MGKITSPFVWKIIVCSENLGEWKELDWLLTDLGVAHIYNCILVFQQFHQIE